MGEKTRQETDYTDKLKEQQQANDFILATVLLSITCISSISADPHPAERVPAVEAVTPSHQLSHCSPHSQSLACPQRIFLRFSICQIGSKPHEHTCVSPAALHPIAKLEQGDHANIADFILITSNFKLISHRPCNFYQTNLYSDTSHSYLATLLPCSTSSSSPSASSLRPPHSSG